MDEHTLSKFLLFPNKIFYDPQMSKIYTISLFFGHLQPCDSGGLLAVTKFINPEYQASFSTD